MQEPNYGQRQGTALNSGNSLGDAIEQFDPVIQRMEQQRIAIGNLVDRVIGPHPTPVNVRVRAMMRLQDEIDGLLKTLGQAL